MTRIQFQTAILTLLVVLLSCGPPALPRIPAGIDSHRWYLDPGLEKILDAETHSSGVGGNSVELLINGDAAFTRRYQNLSNATFILIKTFIWTDRWI